LEVVDYLGEKSRILRYSNISFELLDERSLPFPSANSWKKENDLYYFSTQQNENIVNGERTNADIIIMNEIGDQKSLFSKSITTNGSTFSFNTESFIKNKAGKIFVSLMYKNTFFNLQGMEAFPEFSVDFGKYGIDNSIKLESTDKQKEYLEQNTSGLAFFPVLNIYEQNIVSFTYYFMDGLNRKFHHYIDLKGSKKIIHTNEIINDINGFPSNVYICSFSYSIKHNPVDGDKLIHIILPELVVDQDEINTDVDGVGIINAEDNPVIMLMRLREEFQMD
ncbi:MAG: hypothetical protein ACXIU2_13340, partial [Cyclobacteriaceae bacterium]